MSNLMRVLFAYTNEHLFDPQRVDPEYRSASSCAGCQEAQLRELLDEDGRRLLSSLLDEIALYHTIEQEAMFLATLALSRELR